MEVQILVRGLALATGSRFFGLIDRLPGGHVVSAFPPSPGISRTGPFSAVLYSFLISTRGGRPYASREEVAAF